MNIDDATLKLSKDGIYILNSILAIIMFGVALDMKIEDFKKVFKSGRGPIIGLIIQFLVLPAATCGLTLIIDPQPSIALGMIMVAACPGGNVSNFVTYLSGSNTALSVSMTAISTALAIFMTPFNVSLWGKLNPSTAPLLKEIKVDGLEMFTTVMIILGIPLFLGLVVSHRFPIFAEKVKKPFKYASIVIFSTFIALAFANNFKNFIEYIQVIFFVVLIHNAMALSLGYNAARLFRLPKYDARAVAIEVGIQNSGLGLALIFSFFGGLGGMAMIAAWWGIWHIVAGLSLAFYWSRRKDPAAFLPAEG